MKKALLVTVLFAPFALWSQCNLSNATTCVCPDGSSECDLLPDMTASYDLLTDPSNNPEYVGQINVSVATPNIGYGPLRVIPTDYFTCGTDTIYSPGGLDVCPDGSAPHQLVKQRIYHKSGNTMTYWERNAGTMTYHPTHNHFHVDDWGIYTLRTEIPGDPNPLDWPIVGQGNKISFCLEDYGSCAAGYYYGFCRDTTGTVITNDGPNYGLGGGFYNCEIDNQGITAGHLDIYYYYLDGMQVYLVPGICNGPYKIVVQIDPHNYFMEQNENNNVIVADITLTDQPEDVDFGKMTVTGGAILSTGDYTVCSTDTLVLAAPPVGYSYTWSNGATTPTINVTEAGTYYCVEERNCGSFYTDTITVDIADISDPSVDPVPEVCTGYSATLTASGGGEIDWYDAPVGGTLLGTGTSFTTPPLFTSTTYYAENVNSDAYPFDAHVGETEHFGGDYAGTTYNGYEVFDALNDFTLHTVKVFTDYAGTRTIELRDALDNVLQSADVDIPVGTSTITLDFPVPAGSGYHLGTNNATNISTFGFVSPQLKRSNADTHYPYTVAGLVNVTTSSYDNSTWYYFYDWNITGEEDITCRSNRVADPVEVKVCDGVGDLSKLNTVNIFPNPADGLFHISVETSQVDAMSVFVTNITGQQVYLQNFGSVHGKFDIPVDLHDAPQGIYTVHIIADGSSVTRNVVIQ